MTKLELINKFIKETEVTLDFLKNYKPTSVHSTEQKIKRYEHHKKNLELLNQIKNEVEAWEESKKYFILNEGFVPFYESTYEYITLKNDCIDESNSEEEGISIIKIKKALEVE